MKEVRNACRLAARICEEKKPLEKHRNRRENLKKEKKKKWGMGVGSIRL
jgi:hypothetical protein